MESMGKMTNMLQTDRSAKPSKVYVYIYGNSSIRPQASPSPRISGIMIFGMTVENVKLEKNFFWNRGRFSSKKDALPYPRF